MAEPKPDVEISEPDEGTFRVKEAFVTERLDRSQDPTLAAE